MLKNTNRTHRSLVSIAYKTSAFLLAFLLFISPIASVFAQEVQPSVPAVSSDLISATKTTNIDTPTKDTGTSKTETSIDRPKDIIPINTDTPKTDTPTPKDKNSTPTPKENEEPTPLPESSPTPPFNPENLTAGLTAANYKTLQVDQSSGALIYKYPIMIPPGRNDLQPDIQLEYNNQQARNYPNLIGYGWNISIPYIDRINKTGTDKLYTDNYFNSSLSGELVDLGSGNYVPQVENGDFLSYTYANNTWVVKDKKGTTYTFGYDTYSRQDDPNNSARIFKWMLYEIRDTNDNYISYSYSKDGNQIYPDTITYTGNGSTPGIFQVVFVRETSARTDIITSYATGFLVTTNYRIGEIQIFVDMTMVRKYEMGYTAGDNGTRSLLASITETGYDANSTQAVLPPIQFNYSVSNPGWTIHSTTYTSPVPFQYGYQSMLDINGDALPDIIESWYDNPSANGITTYLNDTHNSWSSASGLTPPIYFRQRETRGGVSSQVWDQGVRIGDVNGDLLPDMIKSEDNANSNGGVDAYLNTSGSSWTQDSNWYPTATLNGDDNISSWGGHFMDINGDGLIDIIHKRFPTTEAQINTGTGFGSVTTAWDPPVYLEGPDTQFADVNNDGLPDIIYMWFNLQFSVWTRDVYLNAGDGTWVQDNSFIPPIDIQDGLNHDIGVRFFDVNGDGLVDEVPDYSLLPGVHTNLNTGVGWTQASAWDLQQFLSCDFMNHPESIADINADGLIDFFCTQNQIPTITNAWLNNTTTPPDLLTGITFPQGGTSAITYKKSSKYYDSSNNLLNPHLPISLDTVETVTTDDNNGIIGTTTYSYEGGLYYLAVPPTANFLASIR